MSFFSAHRASLASYKVSAVGSALDFQLRQLVSVETEHNMAMRGHCARAMFT